MLSQTEAGLQNRKKSLSAARRLTVCAVTLYGDMAIAGFPWAARNFFQEVLAMSDVTRFELADREAGMARENEQLALATRDKALREQCWEFARQHWRKAQLLLSDAAARETAQLLGGSFSPGLRLGTQH
jgi:hypothetical protein